MTQTDPGFKGDTATNVTKPATLETGAEVKVPLFIDEGEMIQLIPVPVNIWSVLNQQ